MPDTNPAESILQSPEQQAAVLGHAIKSSHWYEQCEIWGVKSNWYRDPFDGILWSKLTEFVSKFHRHPTSTELLTAAKALQTVEEAKRLEQRVSVAMKFSSEIGQDTLVEAVKDWSKGEAIKDGVMRQLQPVFGRGDMDQSAEIVSKLSTRLDAIARASSTTNRFESASARTQRTRAIREAGEAQTLPYGIAYLDEALGGIGKAEVVLIGATSGAGKTEVLANIVRAVCESGKRVASFVLEESEEHMAFEDRIKFTYMISKYIDDGKDASLIRRGQWFKGQHLKEMGPYEDHGQACVEDKLKGLITFYRSHGDFTIENLEQQIMKVAPYVDLITLDHISYVDLPQDKGASEHTELRKVVSKINDLTREMNVPIVVVSQLRKDQGGLKNQTLVPTQDDLYGSAHLRNVASTIIVFAKAPPESLPPYDGMLPGAPTYVSIRKSRHEGTGHTSVCFFDRRKYLYLKPYAIGYLQAEKKWIATPTGSRPRWATSSVCNFGTETKKENK